MKKFLVVLLVTLGLTAQASAMDVYWTWPELRERTSDPLNALKCYLMSVALVHECKQIRGTVSASCTTQFLWFPTETQFNLNGSYGGSQYTGQIGISGSAPFVRTTWASDFGRGEPGVDQRFFYTSTAGHQSACEILHKRTGEIVAHFYGDP